MQSPDILPLRRRALLGWVLVVLMVLAAALIAWRGIDAGAQRLAVAQLTLLPRMLALEQLRHDADAPIRAIDGFAARASLSRFRAGGVLSDERPQMDEAWQALADALAAYAARDPEASAAEEAQGAPASVLTAGQRLLDRLRATAAAIDRGVSPIARADSGRLLRAGAGQFRGTLDEELGRAHDALTAELGAASAATDRAWWTLGVVLLPMLFLTLAAASGIVRRLVRPSRLAGPEVTAAEQLLPAVGRRRAGEPDREMTMIDNWLSRALATYPLPGGIALHTQLTSGAQAIIERDRFLRVLVILLDNAVQAMTDEPAASSRDRARTITVRSETAGPHLRLSVMDTGPGIPAERLADIFDASDAADGLPTVRRIVEEHGGTVDIESATDQGTDIVIWLPRLLRPAADLPLAREEAAA